MQKILFALVSLVIFASVANAQTTVYSVQTGTCCVVTSSNVVHLSGQCCVSSAPDETTIAGWVARNAVNRQLDWYDEKKVEKLDRAALDEMQERVDALCKWAATLSNHIFRKAYIEWGTDATMALEHRRQYLDKLDVAESLVGGLPTPPFK